MISSITRYLRTPTAERASLAGLVLLLGFAGLTMMIETAWQDGAPGLSGLPEPGNSRAGLAMVLFYTLQACLATSALFMRRISLFVIFCVSIAMAPTVLLYGHLVETIGFGAPAVQVDEFARVILSGLSAAVLLAPWFCTRMRWPARTPGHLAIGIAVMAGATLQVVFHFVLVIPGSEQSFARYEEVSEVIARSASAEEISRLVEISALPLEPLTRETAERALAAAGAVAIPSLLESIDAIFEVGPATLHQWQIPGQSKIDRMAIIYDGRGSAPLLWLMPSEAFIRPRLVAISAYYYLTGLSGFIWTVGALLVHAGHARRRR